MRNPYHILEVPRSASSSDIRSAFRRKAKDLHPDTHADDPAAEGAFKDLTQAYSLLNDTANRQLYDRGYVDFYGNPMSPEDLKSGKGPNGSGEEGQSDGFFGWAGARSGGKSKQGKDVRYELNVPFETAICGGGVPLLLKTGKKVSVAIPGGAQSGQVLRLKSLGTTTSGFGAPGDALVELTIKHSPLWLRDGDDIRMRAGVGLKTAVLGGRIKISTPAGDMLARVPPGSNTGSVLRLRGHGVQKTDASGDLFVRLEIVLQDPKAASLRTFVEGMDD